MRDAFDLNCHLTIESYVRVSPISSLTCVPVRCVFAHVRYRRIWISANFENGCKSTTTDRKDGLCAKDEEGRYDTHALFPNFPFRRSEAYMGYEGRMTFNCIARSIV